jgi:MtaA/CmuA family methyltransferase
MAMKNEVMMTPYERVMRRLRGDSVDRPPNFDIMMGFAAHYIGQPLARYYQDYRVLCDANLAAVDAFELDIVQAISDPYREAADFGADIVFPEDGLPVCRVPLLRDPTMLPTLPTPDPSTSKRMSNRLEAVRLLRERVGGAVPVMGWVEGALAEAADLRGVSALLTDLYDRPEWVAELLERCVEVEIAFAKAQIEAGADIIGLGDAVASQISPRMYRQWALPYEQRIFAAVHEMTAANGTRALARLHICGDTNRIVADMASTGADIIDVDWMVDIPRAIAVFGDGPVLCGTFDPVSMMLQGTSDAVYEAVTLALRQGGQRCISAAGCEIPINTPYANLHAQTRALHDFTSQNA